MLRKEEDWGFGSRVEPESGDCEQNYIRTWLELRFSPVPFERKSVSRYMFSRVHQYVVRMICSFESSSMVGGAQLNEERAV